MVYLYVQSKDNKRLRITPFNVSMKSSDIGSGKSFLAGIGWILAKYSELATKNAFMSADDFPDDTPDCVPSEQER